MGINWTKFIALNMPIVMRQKRIFNFLRVLLSDIEDINSRGEEWRTRALQRASYNSSAIMLERMIREQMGAAVEIHPLDNSSYDFKVVVVKAGDSYDDARLRALIDTYKPADKAYYIENGAVEYEVSYTDYQCEQVNEVISVEFMSYRCEEINVDIANTITLVVDKTEEGETEVYAISEYPVASPIVVTLMYGQQLHFEVGASRSNGYIPSYGDLIDKWTILDINPAQDEYYHYQPGTVIQWRTRTTDISAR